MIHINSHHIVSYPQKRKSITKPQHLLQGTQGNRAAAERSRTTGWGWHGGGNSAGPVDPGDYDTDEANASMAMLPAIPCRQALRANMMLVDFDIFFTALLIATTAMLLYAQLVLSTV